eukprot:scaffold104956_cov28-Tisochrysis_lutea.AAC.12
MPVGDAIGLQAMAGLAGGEARPRGRSRRLRMHAVCKAARVAGKSLVLASLEPGLDGVACASMDAVSSGDKTTKMRVGCEV